MELGSLANLLRNYDGVRRKKIISSVCGILPTPACIAHFGEDAAVIGQARGEVLLLASDGIIESLVRRNPRWAGYCSILVNVNDIYTMGGEPIAMVNMISARTNKILTSIAKGMAEAVRKFRVPMVGGHTHPGAGCDSVSVAIVGRAGRSEVILSHTAKPGDTIIFAADLAGEFTHGLKYSWDSTSAKSSRAVIRRLSSMRELGKRHLATAGKDISMPGTVGTLGMLVESSGCGADFDTCAVPIPRGITVERWLLAYQGCGFLVTCRPRDTDEILRVFSRSELSSAPVGQITRNRQVCITRGREKAVVFDFVRDSITGIHRGSSARPVPGLHQACQ